ncbi:MAG TPA: cation:proton antiporter, partial [Dehalococcoidia bacterium]|nr:cation:proton antiporter [Dehalococcoidia bacterium]
MEASGDLFISLALILLTARLGGQLSSMLGLPSVFGVLITGVVLGPSVTDLVEPTDSLGGLANIGVVLLLFIAGLETDLVELRTVGVPATL